MPRNMIQKYFEHIDDCKQNNETNNNNNNKNNDITS